MYNYGALQNEAILAAAIWTSGRRQASVATLDVVAITRLYSSREQFGWTDLGFYATPTVLRFQGFVHLEE